MIKRFLRAVPQTSFKNRGFSYLPLNSFSSNGNFSSLLLNPQAARCSIDLHISDNSKKRFFIDRDVSLQQLEAILRKEDETYQSIVFKTGKEEVKDKETKFIDAVLNANLKIEVNRKIFPVDIDLNGPIAYHNNHPLDPFLAENEVPINDSLLITTFLRVYQENLEKKYPGKQSYDPKQLMEALEVTLQNFRVKNDKEVALIQQTLSELEVEQAKDQAEYNRLMNEVTKKASSWIKYIIVAVVIQWAVLFYLTYYSVGWDVTEPIGYLIALGIECAGMIYFVKHARNMEQRALFNSLIKKHKDTILKRKSTNPEAELDFINRRVKYMNQRILYSKST